MLPFELKQEIDFTNATSSRAHLNPLTCEQAEMDRPVVAHPRFVGAAKKSTECDRAFCAAKCFLFCVGSN